MHLCIYREAMKKCLYAGCNTEESSDNIFHKVVGSSGRDGNPLYICSEHFARLKSSKNPSKATCDRLLSKPAAATRKENKRQFNAKDEEEKRNNLEAKGIVQNEVKGKTTGDSQNRKDIQELWTFGPRRRSSLPSILRRKSGDNVSNLRQKTAEVGSTPDSFQSPSFRRETESVVEGIVVVEDEKELRSVRQKRELELNQQSEIEVREVNQEQNETKIQSENNTEVKRCDQLTPYVNKNKEIKSWGTSKYPTWLLDKFIYEYDDEEVDSAALQTFSTTSPEHPVDNKQNREETGLKGSPNGYSTLAINNLTSLEANECNKNEIENTGHQENYELKVHNQQRTLNKQQAFEIIKHNRQGNAENKYYLVAKKVNETIKYCLVKKDSVKQTVSNKPNIEMKKLRLKGSATNLNLEKNNYSKERNEAPLEEGDQMVEEDTIDEQNPKRNPGDEQNPELEISSHEKSKMKSIISLGVNEPNILDEYKVKKGSIVKIYGNNVRKKKKHKQEKDETNNYTHKEIDDGNLIESSVNKDCLERIELEKKGREEFNTELWMECYDELNVEEHPAMKLSIEGKALYDFNVDECELLLSIEASRPNQLSFDQYDEFLNGDIDLQCRFGEHYEKFPHGDTVGGLGEDRKKGVLPHYLQRRSCSAAGCDSKFPEVRLFRFPCYVRAKARHKIWSEFVNKDTMMGYLCHRHFRVVDFQTPYRIKMNRGANPSYHTGPLNPITQDYCPFEDSGGLKEAVYCSAFNCGLSQKTHPDVTFAAFPSKADSRYQEWLSVAGDVRNPRFLCARHFDSTQFSDNTRAYLKNRAIPQYKSGPLNPETNDYSPIPQDDFENSPGNSPASVIEIDITNDSPVTDQNIKISATSPAVGRSIKISADSPLVGQEIKVISGSPLVGQKVNISAARLTSQNMKMPSVSGFLGQKVKIAPVDSAVSKISVVTTNAGENLKIPSKSLAKCGPNSSNEKDDTSNNDEQDQMYALRLHCDASGCPSSYKSDPSVKYFSFPGKASNSSASEKKRRQHWMDAVGGTKQNKTNYLCQYHFATDAFYDKKRTALVRKTNPLFPYGPLNPVTKDYCPIGEEQRSLNSKNCSRARCCVDGCTTYSFNTSGLFGFPIHDREAYEEWTRRVGVHQYFSEKHIRMKFRICPKHFSSCCTILDKDTNSIRLKFGALPTINVPCYKGPPTERNSFVQIRKMSTDEIEALKMLSESDRICDLHDICDKENDEQTSMELKRKMSVSNFTKVVPNKKSKNDSSTADHNKQLILLPIQDESGQQTYVVADFTTNENFASIARQRQNVESEDDGSVQTSVPQHTEAEGVKDETKVAKLLKTPVCTYWSPDEIFDKQAVKKKQEEKKAREQLERMKAKPNISARFRLTSGVNKTIREPFKGKTAKEMYEDFSLVIEEDNIGNEVDINIEEDPLEQPVINPKPPVLPTEKTDSTETALLKVFGSCEASDDNVFSCLTDPTKVPDHEEDTNVHSYCSSNSLNVIRSAAELCEFNDLKIKQLERLIEVGEDTSTELEKILVKHLSSVMCITGVDFLKKCFDQVLKEAVAKKKEKDKGRRHSKTEPPVPLNERYPENNKKLAVALQTFSGKAYHAMTQLIDLPAQSITRDWTTHMNGNPGFSEQAFKMLSEELVTKRKGLTVSLGMEEVPLKQDVSWDGDRAFGLTDLGYGAIDYDYIPEATRAIVFFATALNRTWKIPLGYCLADNLTPSVRANLVIQYLYKLSDIGIKCIALVCNYSLVSYQMLVELGAISEEYCAPLIGSFPHPSNRGDRVHCFVDIHQLIKSINTLWAEKKSFEFKSKDAVEWSHMERMNEFIQSDKTFPNTGLDKVYNDLLSLKALIKRDPRSSYKYNALVLTLLENLRLDGFENVIGTTTFLDQLNSIIDLFSSCHPQSQGERQPLNKGNVAQVTQKLNSKIAYFNNLTYGDGTKVLTSHRKLPFVLLFSNITSLKTMIKKVFTVDKYKLTSIKTESLNLDYIHQTLLEITNGKDGLLTPLEFKNAFFKFVATFSLEPSSRITVCKASEEISPHPVESSLGFSNAFSYQFSPFSTVCESVSEFFTENVIENWLQVTHCTDCSQLIQKELLKYGNHDSKGNVIDDIHRMLRMAETILAELDEIPKDAFTLWFDKLANRTLNSLTSLKGFKNNSHLFNSKPFGEVTHFTVMIKDMLRIFLRLRLCFLARQEKIRIKPPRQYSLRFCLGRSWA